MYIIHILGIIVVCFACLICFGSVVEYIQVNRQKSRDPQQPRMYVAAVRNRTSISTAQQPSIYITPCNMPPPKYEAMAPPSYEEVVGIHYPTFSPSSSQQPPPPTGSQPPPPAPAASASRSAPAETTVNMTS